MPPTERHEKRPDKSVPLVMYKGGERIVIGQALVKGDGSIEGQISKDVRKELKDILFGDMLGGLSIDPKPPVDLKYHDVANHTPGANPIPTIVAKIQE